LSDKPPYGTNGKLWNIPFFHFKLFTKHTPFTILLAKFFAIKTSLEEFTIIETLLLREICKMPFRTHLLLAIILLFLTACEFFPDITGKANVEEYDENRSVVQLNLAVAPQIAWMPWYLADQEGIFHEHSAKHRIQVQFIPDNNYQDTIDKFITEEVQAIAISNIDAIAQLVRRDIEADVILITNTSNGNEAILLPSNADTSLHSLRGKTFALVKNASRHYLFDRYLIRNQIAFDEINIVDTVESDIPDAFLKKEIYGVVTSNPNLHKLTHAEESAKVLFDSRQIPGEIFDLLIIRRKTLLDYPQFAQVLLATWFSVMERLQGSKKGPTLDALASLANLTRSEYEQQLITTPLHDTSTKALSAIRDRRIKKAMRHLRYFIERHQLTGNEVYIDWVSYPGRNPALLHFNGQPLQYFVAPPPVSDE
jgi:NitT/TauT family transport system substrate-binding protein